MKGASIFQKSYLTGITIAVFGSSSVLQDSEHALVAYRVGKLCAEAGFVVRGGYKGTMEHVVGE